MIDNDGMKVEFVQDGTRLRVFLAGEEWLNNREAAGEINRLVVELESAGRMTVSERAVVAEVTSQRLHFEVGRLTDENARLREEIELLSIQRDHAMRMYNNKADDYNNLRTALSEKEAS